MGKWWLNWILWWVYRFFYGFYPLENCPITMGNHHFSWENSGFRLGHLQSQSVFNYRMVVGRWSPWSPRAIQLITCCEICTREVDRKCSKISLEQVNHGKPMGLPTGLPWLISLGTDFFSPNGRTRRRFMAMQRIGHGFVEAVSSLISGLGKRHQTCGICVVFLGRPKNVGMSQCHLYHPPGKSPFLWVV